MKTILILAALALSAAACGGSSSKANSTPATTASGSPAPTATAKPSESPGDALKRQFGFLEKGQFGREWDELHPAQQALVTRDQYEQCAAGHTVPEAQIDVIETYDDTIAVAGVTGVASKAVTIKEQVGSQSDTTTRHEVLVDGKWRWVLTDAVVAMLHSGKCS